jgi:hypothetical protein
VQLHIGHFGHAAAQLIAGRPDGGIEIGFLEAMDLRRPSTKSRGSLEERAPDEKVLLT